MGNVAWRGGRGGMSPQPYGNRERVLMGDPVGRVTIEMLPVSCWPDSDLWALRASIARALKAGRCQGHDLLTALSWADLIDGELEARGLLPAARGQAPS
jgi:hypothetical protein